MITSFDPTSRDKWARSKVTQVGQSQTTIEDSGSGDSVTVVACKLGQ
jgi:hypothetical protein